MNSSRKENFGKMIFVSTACISVLAVVAIFAFLILESLPAFGKIGFFDFLLGTEWKGNSSDIFTEPLEGSYGILTMIVGTIFSTVTAVIFGGTLGFFTAVYLACFCKNKRVKKVVSTMINLLAGIPSVIFGFFGMVVLLPFLGIWSPNGNGSGLLAVTLILGIMILPTIVAVTKTSIEAVPQSYYEGARALGATHEQAIFGTVVPAAKSGIVASFVLGVGRAIGETMAVVMVAGNNSVFPTGLFQSFRTMTANVVLEMGYAGEVQLSALIATGAVLLFFVLIINLCFGALTKQKQTKKSKSTFIPDLMYKIKGEKIGKGLGVATTTFTVATLVTIIGFVLFNGIPHITPEFLFTDYQYGGEPSLLPSLVSTFMLIVMCIIIAVPLGVCTAIFLNEYTKKGSKAVKVVRKAIDILAGVPSVVYGLFGMIFFCDLLGLGTSILAGSLTVTIMLLPVVVKTTEESLKSVPDSFREGSYALGAGKLRTIFRVVLPAALPGILSAVILGMGRALSESAPLMFTMGSSLRPMPTEGLLSSGSSLAVTLYYLAGEGHYVNEAYATATVLILLVLGINMLATVVAGKFKKKLTGAK